MRDCWKYGGLPYPFIEIQIKLFFENKTKLLIQFT